MRGGQRGTHCCFGSVVLAITENTFDLARDGNATRTEAEEAIVSLETTPRIKGAR